MLVDHTRSHSTVHSHHIRLFPFLGSCVWLVVSRVDAWHFEQLYAALVLESASSGCGVSTTISTFAPAHIRLFAFSAHSAHSCYKFMCGLTRERMF